MHEGVLQIRDVQGPRKEGSDKTGLAVVELEIFKCHGMVESGLSANHSMIRDFIREHNMDIKEIVEAILNTIPSFKTFKLKSMIYETRTVTMNPDSKG
ncbi:hypothetical protein D1007_13977 [Hordeum vulgare]|nr:hypothetical protein D1007_13977 [Hordeum vulgare]